MEEFAWLFRLVPEGAAVSAVMAVVILFLKHITQLANSHTSQMAAIAQEHKETVKGLTKQFTDQLTETRSAFSSQLKEVATMFSDRQEKIETKVQMLHDGHMQTQSETIVVLTCLKEAINRIESKG